MQDATSKEKVLKKVRKALIHKSNLDVVDVDNESEIYVGSGEPLEFTFAQNFSALNGKFIFCENDQDFVHNLSSLVKENQWTNIFCFEKAIHRFLQKGEVPFSENSSNINAVDIGITFCEILIARTGSVLISSKQASGRRLPMYANIHIVVAYTSQLVYNIKDGLKMISAKYGDQIPSMIANISGPSRTADIEKTLVQGAHGPKEIFVFLIDDTISK